MIQPDGFVGLISTALSGGINIDIKKPAEAGFFIVVGND